MYLLVTLDLQPAQKKRYLGSWLTQNSVLIMFLPFVVKLAKNTLERIASFMSFEKRRTLMKGFIECQFNYCPLM